MFWTLLVSLGWARGMSDVFLALAQVYREVQLWDPPSSGLRSMVLVGAMTLPAQVPAVSTLPPPPPLTSSTEPEHPFTPLPVVRQANGCETIQGAFFEVCCRCQLAPSSLKKSVNFWPSLRKGQLVLRPHL